MIQTTEKATFGAGCFWGVEANFRSLKGVTDAAVGYAGGQTQNPTYKDVCAHGTGHAEVVQVDYDPAKISYEQLLAAFFKMHNPTQVNRQGFDVGDQYRSVIFYHTPEQEAAARKAIAELESEKRYTRPVATQIEAAPTFYRGEEYHQQYSAKHGRGHCSI